MKRLQLFITSLSLVLCLGGLVPVTANAAATDDPSAAPSATQTACSALGSNDCTDNSSGPGLNKVVKSIINILSLVVGIASVVMIIVGGLRYVISNGDANAITGAKNTILYALVGLIVVALAQFIVQFVLGKVT